MPGAPLVVASGFVVFGVGLVVPAAGQATARAREPGRVRRRVRPASRAALTKYRKYSPRSVCKQAARQPDTDTRGRARVLSCPGCA